MPMIQKSVRHQVTVIKPSNLTLNPTTGINFLSNVNKNKWYCFRVINTSFGVVGTGRIGPASTNNPDPRQPQPQEPNFKFLRATNQRVGLFIDPRGQTMTTVSAHYKASSTCNSSVTGLTSTSYSGVPSSLSSGFGTGTKVAWVSLTSANGFNLNSTSAGRICLKVVLRLGDGSNQTYYKDHVIPPKPNIVVTTSAPTWSSDNTINSFADLAGANKIYPSASNINGGSNKREISLQSGHDGLLEGTSYSGSERFANTWGYRKYGTTEPTCNTTGYTQIPSSQRSWTTGANYLNVDDLDTTKWYCFQVRNTVGITTTKKFGPASSTVTQEPNFKFLRATNQRVGLFIDPRGQTMTTVSAHYKASSTCNSSVAGLTSTSYSDVPSSLSSGFGTGTKVAWVSLTSANGFNLNSTSAGRICLKVVLRLGDGSKPDILQRPRNSP